MDKKVILKPGREKALINRHPWIFSGAIASFPAFENGDILSVFSDKGSFLAKGYFHRENSIAGRILTFEEESVEQAIRSRLKKAIALRERLFDKELTNCYRLINAEGDELPGLIIDIYDEVAVIQIHTLGMERLKSLIVELLQEMLPVKGIYEKSLSAARKLEGLEDSQGALSGECPEQVLVKENGVNFLIPIVDGQKTGFFLDQREMRQLTARLGKDRKVLNCFSYTGGFSLFALKGGAATVTSIDASELACHLARENTLVNHLDRHHVIQADVFDYLRKEKLDFDFIILDPPAFAKKRQDINEACRGYKEINRLAMEKAPQNAFLLTCSCSHFIDETLFQQVIFQAAIEAKRQVTILSSHLQATDHPISLFHPEGGYLKSLFLHIS